MDPYPIQTSQFIFSKTSGWYKSIWEKVDIFGFMVEINNIPLSLPRKGDQWLEQGVHIRVLNV